MNRGWVRLWRRLLESAVFLDPHLLQLFMYLLLRARHTPGAVALKIRNGEVAQVQLDRGEALFGRNAVARALGMRRASAARRLRKLETLGIVSLKTTPKFTIVTFRNWGRYQTEAQGDEPQSEQAAINMRSSCDQHASTKENDRNDENEGEGGNRSEASPPPANPPDSRQQQRKRCEGYVDQWNALAGRLGLPLVKKISQKRINGVNARVRDTMVENLDAIYDEIESNEFLQGVRGRDSWKGASFDWLFLSPHNWIKVLEGKYRDKGQKRRNRGKPQRGFSGQTV